MPPIAAEDMNIGASNPPDVPEPRESSSATALQSATRIRSFRARLLFRMSPSVSYPTPSTRGTKNPIMPRRERADRGMPEFGNRKMVKSILDEIERLCKNNSRAAA